MYLPTFTNREIYVRHIDVTENKNNNKELTEEDIKNTPKLLGNQNISVGENKNIASAIKNETGYQEKYEIASISNASVSYTNNSKYNYIGYSMSRGTSKAQAKKDMDRQIEKNILQNLNELKNVTLDSSNVDDYIFIDFYYTKKEGNDSLDDINKITGRLSFETTNSNLASRTVGNQDIIPAGINAKVGFTGADIYKIAGVNYEEKASRLNIEVTVNKKYKVKDNLTSEKIKTEKFEYTIDYSLYKLNNFKLFKISKLELFDTASNVGGKLFGNSGDTTTIGLSNSFSDKFSNFSTNVNKYNIQVKMGQKIYDIENIKDQKLNLVYDIDVGIVETDDKVITPTRADIPKIIAEFKNDELIVNGQPLLDGKTESATIQNGYLDKTNVALPGFDTWAYYTASEVRPKTTMNDFLSSVIQSADKKKTSELTISSSISNGLRKLEGKIYYEHLKDGLGRGTLNVGSDDFIDTISGKKAPVSIASKDIKDTETEDNVDDVIIQTPVVQDIDISQQVVWHYEEEIPKDVIQKTGRISIKPITTGVHETYGEINTANYIYATFVKFDFDVIVRKNAVNFKEGDFVSAGKWIATSPGNNIEVSLPDNEFNNILNIDKNDIVIKSIALNYRQRPINIYNAVINGTIEKTYEEEGQNGKMYDNKYGDGTLKESNYVAYKELKVPVANRIFDFKVTNIKDSVYEDVFKNGYVYYSGLREYTPYNYKADMKNRVVKDNFQVLPIGPISLIGSRESTSPELSSKISFDFKTTGKFGYSSNEDLRKIQIVPEYYYIDENGKEIYGEDTFKLYYKNDKNKYVALGSAEDTFRIKMIPKDGVRTKEEVSLGYNISNMSQYEVEIGTYKDIKLTKSNMAVGNNDFVQTWYGEFYLPKDVIVVNSNVKNPKEKDATKTGYLAVKFNIKSIEPNNRVLSYQSNLSGKNNSQNQWAIEGYTAIFNLKNSIKLNINKDKYLNALTGTVVIYDLSK